MSTTPRWLLTATAALAGAALVRVQRERRADRPPDSAVPPWEPQALARLATWVPAPPPAPAARAAAYLWAAPLSLAGLVLGVVAGARPRRHEGALLFAGAGGPVRGYLEAGRFSAFTLGHVIVALDEPSPPLLAHELVHVRQSERLGVLMAPLYLVLLVAYGYRANPLERAARIPQRALAAPPSGR